MFRCFCAYYDEVKHVWGRLYCQCHFYSKSAFNQGVSIASWRCDYQIKIQFNPHCVLTHLYVCCVKSASRSARGCCLTWSDMRWSDLRDCPGDTRGACGTTRWGNHTFLSHLPHLADFFIYILLQCSGREFYLNMVKLKTPQSELNHFLQDFTVIDGRSSVLCSSYLWRSLTQSFSSH